MKRLLLIAGFFLTSALSANMGPQGFYDYVQEYFVETGSLGGAGIQKALDAGFKEVRSMEINKDDYLGICRRFQHKKNVKPYHGNSATDLWEMIKDIEKPVTFWLDAHVFPPIKGRKNCPLIEELEQIKQHPIKTHIILIDDMHCCGLDSFDFLTKEDLIEKIKEINPLYEISYVPGGDKGEYPQNVMVAKIPNEFFE